MFRGHQDKCKASGPCRDSDSWGKLQCNHSRSGNLFYTVQHTILKKQTKCNILYFKNLSQNWKHLSKRVFPMCASVFHNCNSPYYQVSWFFFLTPHTAFQAVILQPKWQITKSKLENCINTEFSKLQSTTQAYMQYCIDTGARLKPWLPKVIFTFTPSLFHSVALPRAQQPNVFPFSSPLPKEEDRTHFSHIGLQYTYEHMIQRRKVDCKKVWL